MMEVLLKGIGVGVAVAAPVGPIGLLCIKRTLSSGKVLGLMTGLGAACADALYGLLVAAGMSVTGLLINYAKPLELFGGLMITVLGLLSIRSFYRRTNIPGNINPTGHHQASGVLTAFLSSFVLTLSNPMTILAFIALVTGLGASAGSREYAAYFLVFGVFLGSAIWWIFLVSLAAKASSRINSDSMRWLDLVSGVVLAVWGVWIFVRAL